MVVVGSPPPPHAHLPPVTEFHETNESRPTNEVSFQATEDIGRVLQGLGVKCLVYHAGLSMERRYEAHRKFVRDEVEVRCF